MSIEELFSRSGLGMLSAARRGAIEYWLSDFGSALRRTTDR
jgi:hypothetical protein